MQWLVCDDHALMRDAVAGTVKLCWRDAVVALASDYAAALEQAGKHDPDFILTDLGMPGAAPLQGIAALQAAAPQARLIVITGQENDEMLIALLRLGIAGFVPKSMSAEVVEAALRLVVAGGRYLPSRLAQLALEAEKNGLARTDSPVKPADLTPRQRDVLALIAQGRTTKEIARLLALSPATVKAHTASIIAALGTNNRTEAAFKGRTLGLVS